METRKDNKLESLDAEKKKWILETAPFTELKDMVTALQEHGVITSIPSLSRFIRRHQEKELLEEGNEMKESVEALALRGAEGKLREGTLEAVRQRLYERALSSQSPEEARLLYAAMVKEETRLKELELEARKVAIAEEELKLQRLRLEMEARRRVRVVAESSKGVINQGEHGGHEEETKREEEPVKQLGEGLVDQRPMELLGEVMAALNRGGTVEEKLLEARAMIAEGVRRLGVAN